MRNMDFTMEQIQKAMTANSAEELFAMAKEDGIELTLTEAEEYYSELHKNQELSDDELSAITGGKGEYNGIKEGSRIAKECGFYMFENERIQEAAEHGCDVIRCYNCYNFISIKGYIGKCRFKK